MMTLAQLYNLGLSVGVDIFDGITIPEDCPINRTIMINTIMEKNGLNIPMYSDVNVFASAVTLWSAKHQYTFEHVAKILDAEYSPIENTDKYEDITVKRDLKDDTKLDNKKNEILNNNGSDTNTVEDKTSAYNASDYQPDSKTTTSTEYASGNIRDTKINGVNNKVVDENTRTINHTHGNIGVTTNTTLQIEEYKLLKDYNPYNFLASVFENELTLFIY